MDISSAKDNLKSSQLQKHKQTLRASSSSAAMTALMLAVVGVATVGAAVGFAPTAKAADLRGNAAVSPVATKYYGGYGNGWGGNDGNKLGTAAAAAPTNGAGGKGSDASDPNAPHKGKGGTGGAVGSTSIDPSISSITGGAGVAGQNLSYSDGDYISSGGGGGGGAGLYLSDNSKAHATTSGQSVNGGAGGAGGAASGTGSYNNAGNGGGGGAGIIIIGTKLLNASGATVSGGAGGNGGAASGGAALSGDGGSGGDGVVVIGGSFDNYGTIVGGKGGSGGTSSKTPGDGVKGGSAIRIGDGGHVVNAGILMPGASSTVNLNTSIPDPAAIAIVGNNTILELRAGSDIQGNVVVAEGVVNNTLALGGNTNSTFAASEIGGKYKGFDGYKKTGTSTWDLTGSTTEKTSWTIEGGVLSIAQASSLGDTTGVLTLNGGALQTAGSFDMSRDIFVGASNGTIDVQSNANILKGIVSGDGRLTKSGSGVLKVTGDLNQTGGTALNAGTLQIGNGGIDGAVKGNVAIANGATLEFNHSNVEIYEGALSGNGFLKVDSPGGVIMKGDSSAFTGTAAINGTTTVNGILGASAVTVSSTGELDGNGRVMGNTTIESGGKLAGTQGTTMQFDKNLVLASGSILDLELGTATNQALFSVGGDLTLNSKINVSSIGGFGAGTYRVFDYTGNLVNAATVTTDVTFGTLPSGISANDLTLVTSNAHQISILNTAGATVNVWDGSSPGGGSVSGGSGIWNTNSNNWTETSGVATNLWTTDEFAIFQTVGGTVTIDNTAGQVSASGMQFAVDGYKVEGQPLVLHTSTGDTPIVRVGDGTVAGAAITATIASEIQGNQGLKKTDYGTLVLTANNSYTGETIIQNGALQIGDGGTTGSVAGNIVLGNNDTDETRLIYNRSDNVTVANVISGTGVLDKQGSNTLILTGENTYTGGSQVNDGILQIGDGGTSGSIQGPVELVSVDSALVIDLAKNITLDSAISGAGGLTQQGPGVTTVTMATTYTGETKITDGELHLVGDGSISQSSKVTVDSVLDATGIDGSHVDLEGIDGNDHGIIKIGDKNLNITDAKDGVFAGVIEGAGGHVTVNAGTQRLSGENTYTGGTGIDTGATLIIGDGGTKGSVIGEIAVDGTLIYDRSDRYTINPITGDGDLKFEGGGTGVVDTAQEFKGEVVVEENNTLIVEGDGDLSSAEGVTNNGNLDVSGSNADDIRIGHLGGDEKGEVALGEKNLVITNGDGSEYKGTIDGTGGFTVETGKQILSGDNTYTGDTNIWPTAELQLGNDDKAGSITSNVINEGIWSGNGSMKDLLNKGTVSPGTDISFGTLTVNGNYTSENGKLILHEELGGDGSQGDRLVIAGNTSGTTEVTVINRGGLGAQTNNGIKVIEVGGQSDGVFNLNGDYVNYRGNQAVVAGAYAYTLEKGGVSNPDGNWYLRSEGKDKQSEPEYQAGVPVYGGAASGVAMINRGGFASFGTRMNAGGGNANADSDGGQSSGKNDGSMFRENYFWGRVQGGSSTFKPNGSATGGSFGTQDWTIQTGLDGQFVDDASGQLFGSVWLDYTRSKIRSRSDYGNGSVDVNGYGLGAALTWYGANGFYLDGQGKATWYKSDFESDRLSDALASGVKSLGYALSLEAGQRLAIDNQWSVTPQAQLIWSSLNTDSYRDVFGAHVETPDNNSLTGRIGIAADYSTAWREVDNTKTQLTVGGIANIYQELKSGSDYITISDVKVATGTIDKTWAEIGATANYGWNDNKYSVYGKLSGATSLNNFGDSHSVSGNVGFRLKF